MFPMDKYKGLLAKYKKYGTLSIYFYTKMNGLFREGINKYQL